jgi:hypothetical protein
MIRLAESFDGFRAKLSSVGTLVGLATKMVDTEDMLLVKRVLSADVWSFLGQLKISSADTQFDRNGQMFARWCDPREGPRNFAHL